jgi:hypothetical protein
MNKISCLRAKYMEMMYSIYLSLSLKTPNLTSRVIYPAKYIFIGLQQLKIDLWIVEGYERNSMLPLKVLFASYDNQNKSYMLDLIFGKSYKEYHFRRDWLWNISKSIEELRSTCSIMLIEIVRYNCKHTRIDKCFFIPRSVFGEMYIPFNQEVTRSKSVLSDLSRIRRNDLKYEVTKDSKYFDDFYYNMYLPMTLGSHGESAKIISYRAMKDVFRYSDLLLVKKKEEYIGGMIIEYENKYPALFVLGVRDGSPDYLKDGTVAALYYFSSLYLEEKGFSKMKTGYSRAFLNDGVLRLKRKWAQRILRSEPSGFALKVLSDTSATKSFLCNNPFIFQNNEHLSGAVFIDKDSPLLPEDYKQINKKYFYPGLSKIFLYNFKLNDLAKTDISPSEIPESILLYHASDIL